MEPSTAEPYNSFSDNEASSATAEAQLSVEERLIEKIAEFEGKVEALQSLKANLYEAIEQLDIEQRES